MVIVGNWRVAVVGSIVSLIIFGVIYFTVIKPDNNTANQALKTGLQQTQQALSQQKAALSAGAAQAASAGAGAASPQAKAAANAAVAGLTKAQKLTSCIQAAGTDVSAASACTTKYSG